MLHVSADLGLGYCTSSALPERRVSCGAEMYVSSSSMAFICEKSRYDDARPPATHAPNNLECMGGWVPGVIVSGHPTYMSHGGHLCKCRTRGCH